MAQEHQEYIQTKVNPTLESLVTQVLLTRPENPAPFMIRWLADQTNTELPGGDAGQIDSLRKEVATLQSDIRELESKLSSSVGSGQGVDAQEEEEEEEEEEEDDNDEVDEMPPPPASYLTKGPRASVSAEAYGAWNQVQDFAPPVHHKSDDQKQRLQSLLATSFLFNTLDRKSMDIIIDAMLEQKIETATRIIQEGDDGNVMFIIEQGHFECIKKIGGEEKTVKTCNVGDFFGELALLYNCPRAASVEARDTSVVWQLDRDTFNNIVRDAAMKKREAHEAFLKSVPLLESMEPYDRSQLADSLKREEVAAGDLVIRQGEEGDRLFIVEEGELYATKSIHGTDEQVMVYKKGDFFGELSLLRKEMRAATVAAKTEAVLLSVDSKSFNRLFGPLEDLMKNKASEYR